MDAHVFSTESYILRDYVADKKSEMKMEKLA